MSATATLPMPPAVSVGLPYMNTKKPKPDEPQTKHSFDSDDASTAILREVLKAGANKARFINLCIRFAAAQAFQELAAERTRAEREFWRVVGQPETKSKKRQPPSE